MGNLIIFHLTVRGQSFFEFMFFFSVSYGSFFFLEVFEVFFYLVNKKWQRVGKQFSVAYSAYSFICFFAIAICCFSKYY